MSDVFFAAIMLDNEIDANYISSIFNPIPSTVGATESLYDETLFARLSYSGLITINNETTFKHCYLVENGYCLFRRKKYGFFNSDKKVLLSRYGDEIPFHMEIPYDEKMGAEMTSLDSPPVDEIRRMFEYIMSINQRLYIMFDSIYADDFYDKVDNDRSFFESLANQKKMITFKSDDAQCFLFELFGSYYENYDQIVRSILLIAAR